MVLSVYPWPNYPNPLDKLQRPSRHQKPTTYTQSIATASFSSNGGTSTSTTPFTTLDRTATALTRNFTSFTDFPFGTRTRTFCGGDGTSSRTGPFIVIGFVRFTRCAVTDPFC